MRALLKQVALGLLLTLAACAPTVNSQSVPARPATVTPPVAAPQHPAQEAGTKVALLLPLSGPQAALGQSLLNAAQLAVYDLAKPDFALLPADTQSTPSGALAATRQAMADGAQMIIGPVFSAEVEAIAPTARARNIPVLALSNNNALASEGVYVLGQTPDDQVSRILAYAKARSLTRIAAIIPTGVYGAAVEDALRRTVQDNGLSLVHVEHEAPSSDATVIASSVAAALHVAGGADAILIPESGQRLIALASALRSAGISARLLGTAVWDANQTSVNPALAGGWYAALPAQQRTALASRYQQTYGSPAAPIATLAYDATAVAIVLSKAPDGFSAAQLTSATGFSGVDGLFRLNRNGTATRGLAVYELTNAGVRVIDPAPAKFGSVMN